METAKTTSLTIRPFQASDYTDVMTMWKSYNFPPVPMDMLPDTGLIISNGEKDVAAGFIYLSNSKTAWMEWIVADKGADSETRSEALDELISMLIATAKVKGYKYIMMSVQHEKLITRLSDHGFIKTDTNMQNMVRIL